MRLQFITTSLSLMIPSEEAGGTLHEGWWGVNTNQASLETLWHDLVNLKAHPYKATNPTSIHLSWKRFSTGIKEAFTRTLLKLLQKPKIGNNLEVH